MIDFLFHKPKNNHYNADSLPIRAAAARSALGTNTVDNFYKLFGGNTRLWFWQSAGPAHKSLGKCLALKENSLYFYFGYATDSIGTPIADCQSYLKTKSTLIGDYCHIFVSSEGETQISGSEISSYPIYYYEDESEIVIASSAFSISNFLYGKVKLNHDYLRWTLSYSVCSNEEAITKDVKKLLPTQRLSTKRSSLTVTTINFQYLSDTEYQDLYVNNPKVYWDRCFEELTTPSVSIDAR